jgi:hypothetical protein
MRPIKRLRQSGIVLAPWERGVTARGRTFPSRVAVVQEKKSGTAPAGADQSSRKIKRETYYVRRMAYSGNLGDSG